MSRNGRIPELFCMPIGHLSETGQLFALSSAVFFVFLIYGYVPSGASNATFASVALLTVGTMGLSNSSLSYLSYPSQ
eukprot:gene13336-2162_t